jgi:mannonate dehydratase
MNRRTFLTSLGAAGAGAAAWRFWPEDGLVNPCAEQALPDSLADHPLLQAAWQGIAPQRLWDCHVHLIGLGDGGDGLWINPDMSSLAHPIQWLQRYFYLNASCPDPVGSTDQGFLSRLMRLQDAFPRASKLMLLAFDWFHDEQGQPLRTASAFFTPNAYARRLAEQYPERFEWIASVHPYRADAVDALSRAVEQGARAIKWLPAAQGMDPASPRCDPFYRALVKHDLPLLTHAGTELAVKGGNTEDFGNPLRLRRPLEHGVRVLVAHCASLGRGRDLDQAPRKQRIDNFALFARLMEENRYRGRLFGEISGITQINRVGKRLEVLLRRGDWHPRLINGSDYPLPGILPLFSLKQMLRRGYLQVEEGAVLSEIRRYNPLLFDLALKRSLRIDGKGFAPQVFESARVFRSEAPAATGDRPTIRS